MGWRQATFRQQLLAAFLAMALLPALLLALITYVQARQELAATLAEMQAQNLQGAISARNFLAAAVAAGQRVVRDLGDEPRLVTAPTPADRQRLRRLLSDVPLGYNLGIVDARGRITLEARSLPPPSPTDLRQLYPGFDRLLRSSNPIVSQAFPLRGGGGPGLAVGHRIRGAGGGVVGLALVTFGLNGYRQQLTRAAAIGTAPVLYIVDQNGRLVFGTGGKAHYRTFQSLADDPVVRSAREHTSGSLDYYRSPVAAHQLAGAFAVVPTTGWVVVIASDADAVWQAARREVVASLVMLIPASLLALLAAVALSRRYARPVLDLVRLVRGLPDGGTVTPPPSAGTASEFEFLAEAIAETSRDLAGNAAAVEQGRLTLERLLDERTRSLVATNQVVLELAAARDLRRAFRDILPQLEALIGADGAMICQYDPERQELAPIALHVPRLERLPPLTLAGTPAGQSLLDGQPWFETDLQADASSPEAAALARAGYACRVKLPIRLRTGRLLGAVTFAFVPPHRCRQADVDRMAPVIEQLAMAIDRDQLLSDTEQRRRDAEDLAGLAVGFAQSVRLDDVAPLVLTTMRETFAAQRAGLWLLDDAGESARCVAASGQLAPDAVGLRVHIPDSPIYEEGFRRLQQGETVVIRDVAALPYDPAVFARLQVAAFVWLPLITQGRLFGAILLAYPEADQVVGPERLLHARAIAANAASAIANARLFGLLEERRHDAEALARLAGALSRTLRLEEMAPLLLDEMRTSFATDHATLWFVSEDRRMATCVAAVGERATDLVGMSGVREEAGTVPDELDAGHPVLIPHLQTSALAALPLATRFVVRAAAYFPLRSSGELFGFVLLTYGRPEAVFPEHRLDFALALVSQAATAVANARLFERLEAALVHLQSVQEQLIRSERLSALGQLSSFVSHEIKNRFNVITTAASLAEMLAGRVGAEERIKQTMTTIKKEVDRGNDLMLRLLRFARPQEPSQQMVALQAVLDAALLTARRANVRIVRHLPADLPAVPGDPAHLEQVFLNLILNALQAMPNGGTLTVSASREDPWIDVTISDTGLGMSAETLSHLFQPFFTTKPQGTGLGLVISQQIIEQHRGTIACESTPGEGTTFTIRLPMATALPAPDADTGKPEGGPGKQAA